MLRLNPRQHSKPTGQVTMMAWAWVGVVGGHHPMPVGVAADSVVACLGVGLKLSQDTMNAGDRTQMAWLIQHLCDETRMVVQDGRHTRRLLVIAPPWSSSSSSSSSLLCLLQQKLLHRRHRKKTLLPYKSVS